SELKQYNKDLAERQGTTCDCSSTAAVRVDNKALAEKVVNNFMEKKAKALKDNEIKARRMYDNTPCPNDCKQLVVWDPVIQGHICNKCRTLQFYHQNVNKNFKIAGQPFEDLNGHTHAGNCDYPYALCTSPTDVAVVAGPLVIV